MPESANAITPASRLRRAVALLIDGTIVFALLDALRLELLSRMWVGEVNIWLGSAGATGVLYLLWLRGRWIPGPGDWLVDIHRDRKVAPHARVVAGGRPMLWRAFPVIALGMALVVRNALVPVG